MSEAKKFLLRNVGGDRHLGSEQELVDLFSQGRCKGGDFLYDFSRNAWQCVCDFPPVQRLYQEKPVSPPAEKKVIYYQEQNHAKSILGPFSLKEIVEKAKTREICGGTWVFVEGDKEWRQVASVKVLKDALPPLPVDHPASPVAMGAPFPVSLNPGDFTPSVPSIKIEMPDDLAPSAPSAPSALGQPDSHIEREEERTMAFSALGLSAKPGSQSEAPKKPAPLPPTPPRVAASPPPAAPTPPTLAPMPSTASPAELQAPQKDSDTYDGLTAEIPSDPIWLIKQATSETVSGPFRFLDVAKFLEQGKLTKNDKISKMGSKSFVKIAQQYEFNVKFSVETVVEAGVEKQKIFIRRRHPRVPYLADLQVTHKGAIVKATCVNISAGGVLMEAAKADFNLGDLIEVKILPALIKQTISCSALVIGKIPKIPPGFALKFQDLKPQDKAAIEFFVQEAMKRNA